MQLNQSTDAVREDNPIDYLVHVAKLAHPPYPQFGLEPNVYFIPPVHVPPAFLRQMFGPGSVKAVETYRAAKNDKTMLAALLLFGANRDIVSRFRVEGDYSVGFSEAGAELVRLPLREPTYVGETYDEKHQTHRSNIT